MSFCADDILILKKISSLEIVFCAFHPSRGFLKKVTIAEVKKKLAVFSADAETLNGDVSQAATS
jgi:hypothetical protein